MAGAISQEDFERLQVRGMKKNYISETF